MRQQQAVSTRIREERMVPAATPQSYYDRPLLKTPVWKPHVPVYFFTGGLAGASSVLAFGARLTGHHRLARSALLASASGLVPSPLLLIDDLGRPERFVNMLRIFKPTSPLSVGSWVLAAFGPASVGAAGCEWLGIFPRAGRVAEAAAALLGTAVTTYTAVLISDTAVPAWHEGRRELPFVFAGSAAASAGAAAAMLTPASEAAPARRLAVGGAFVSRVALDLMERRGGSAMAPYAAGAARRYKLWATTLTAAGALLITFGSRARRVSVAGGALLLAGGLCERFAIFHAGVQSARATRP
jgi:formate-dependent nitrite reductase membrane component NrfD